MEQFQCGSENRNFQKEHEERLNKEKSNETTWASKSENHEVKPQLYDLSYKALLNFLTLCFSFVKWREQLPPHGPVDGLCEMTVSHGSPRFPSAAPKDSYHFLNDLTSSQSLTFEVLTARNVNSNFLTADGVGVQQQRQVKTDLGTCEYGTNTRNWANFQGSMSVKYTVLYAKIQRDRITQIQQNLGDNCPCRMKLKDLSNCNYC